MPRLYLAFVVSSKLWIKFKTSLSVTIEIIFCTTETGYHSNKRNYYCPKCLLHICIVSCPYFGLGITYGIAVRLLCIILYITLFKQKGGLQTPINHSQRYFGAQCAHNYVLTLKIGSMPPLAFCCESQNILSKSRKSPHPRRSLQSVYLDWNT